MKLFKSPWVMVSLLIVGLLHAKALKKVEMAPAVRILPVAESQKKDLAVVSESKEQPKVEMRAEKKAERNEEKKGERRAKKQEIGTPTLPQQMRQKQNMGQQKLSMEDYARKQVVTLQANLVDDIFPKKTTIEYIVNDFKAVYPGPNKEVDSIILYNAIIDNSEIKKYLTLENALKVYHFIKETISQAWDTQEEIVWRR